MTITVVFSYCKPNSYREIAKEQLQTNYNFIYLCGRDLRPPNPEVVPARRVFRHAGMDVSNLLKFWVSVLRKSSFGTSSSLTMFERFSPYL